jgi:apolipoprotein N-acyltransferase
VDDVQCGRCRRKRQSHARSPLYDVFNAAYLFNPEGQWSGVYHKRQLVIFGEYIPLVDVLPFVKWFTPITGGYTSGKRIKRFTFKGFKSPRSSV